MYRTHSCGELRPEHLGLKVCLSGWVQKHRNKGFIIWVDLRDCYGITQIVFDKDRSSKDLFEKASSLGREFVVQITGRVIERESKNDDLSTGGIEVLAEELHILNASETPPFTIEDETDGGEDLRMKYRYLDIRRKPIRDNLLHRHKIAFEVRNYLSDIGFIEIETPYLINSTPEGARDFVVPSRMNTNEFYALPQSPQTFKQLLMVGGIDKYFQIVKCFRDEDLRSDRQPEFTQIDCEMSFVKREDVLKTFEGMLKHLLKKIKQVEIGKFERMTYHDAIKFYGTDKPDTRFDMCFVELNELAKNRGFKIFDQAELIVGIKVLGGNSFSRKDIDRLSDFVKQPQIGGSGIIWLRHESDGGFKSSVDKFYKTEDLKKWAELADTKIGDLFLIMAGETLKTRKQLGVLRLHIAETLGLRRSDKFAPLWVTDFPLLEWSEEEQRFHAMHHPFTSPKAEDLHLLESQPKEARADAYDLVLNGNEIGGGSIRIFDRILQKKIFELLGFSHDDSEAQFGFLMNAFRYGAPPHGGIAFGLDRLVAILGGEESIRNFIAFPKNNLGRDVMIDAPSKIDTLQLEELHIQTKEPS